MDITEELEQSDSGMESLTASKDETPERKPEDSFAPPEPEIEIIEREDPDNDKALVGLDGRSGTAVDASSTSYGALKEYDDEPDETLYERLWGLSEMFPECVRNGSYAVSTKTWSGMKSLYSLSRSVMWVVASSSVILFAPVIFEVERAQVEEMQKSQQKQVLLGTNTSLAPPMPPMPR